MIVPAERPEKLAMGGYCGRNGGIPVRLRPGEEFFSRYNPPNGLWGFTTPALSLNDLREWAREAGKDWTSPAAQTQFMVEQLGADGGWMALPLPLIALEPLHREFLLTIDHVKNVIGDKEFAEKMREDLLGLWHEDKLAKGLTAPQALGMTEDEYSSWVECKEE